MGRAAWRDTRLHGANDGPVPNEAGSLYWFCSVARNKIMLRLVGAGNGAGDWYMPDVDRLTDRRRDMQFNAVQRSYHIGHEAGENPASTHLYQPPRGAGR